MFSGAPGPGSGGANQGGMFFVANEIKGLCFISPGFPKLAHPLLNKRASADKRCALRNAPYHSID